MDSKAAIDQLVRELQVLTLKGVRRPLPTNKSEASIALLAEIARELADDPTLPLSQLIAEAVHPAVQRAFTDRSRDAAAELLDIDLSKDPNDSTLPVTSRKLGGDRRIRIQQLMGWSGTSYGRAPTAMERKHLLEPVAEQLLALRDIKRQTAQEPELSSVVAADEPGTPKRARPQRGRRLLVGGLGLMLAATAVVSATTLRTHGGSVPSHGAIVDAWTGRIIKHLPQYSNTSGNWIAEPAGGPLMVACVLPKQGKCRYQRPPRPLTVRRGETLRFSVLVHNPSAIPLAWLRLTGDLDADQSSNDGVWDEKVVGLTFTWKGLGSPTHLQPITVRLSHITAASRLAYVEGSTLLYSNTGKLMARLPDGIATDGIVLANVGPPSSCFNCNAESARFVNFEMRVQ